MVTMRLGKSEIEVRDFLVKYYQRRGYEIVTEEPKIEKTEPKKTARKTKKAQ